MIKEFTSLGLMSGTSGDGIDASIIKSNGDNSYNLIKDKYFEYDNDIYRNIHNLKEKITYFKDLEKLNRSIIDLERQITLFHAKVVKELDKINKIDLVGFHGQTVYHNPQEKISKQIGDGKLLSQLTKKNIIYNFRQKDIENGGEGAPLTPIFHQLMTKQIKLNLPVCILNIGGISNITIIEDSKEKFNFKSRDIGPGNCLIDNWMRKNSKKKFDKDGDEAAKGLCNDIIFENAQELFSNRLNKDVRTFDVNDFDISFVRGLSLEDGAATLTEFTAKVITSSLISELSKKDNKNLKIIVCGGGRKNKILMQKIRTNITKSFKLELVDDFGINGDFIESQAFAFLAIRSFLKLPISFPRTTGCEKPSTGGDFIKFK